MSKKFFTFHSKQSSGLGGVETLTRSLHKIAMDCDFDTIEIVPKSSAKEYQHFECTSDKKKIFWSFWKEIRLLSTLLYAFQMLFYFCSKVNRVNSILVVYDLRVISLFPKRYFNDLSVIFVQTSRFDIILNRLSKITLKRLKDEVSALTVYTEIDKNKLKEICPYLDKEKIKPIPRACKLETTKEIKQYSRNIVTVARLVPLKNIEEMLYIMKDLGDEYTLDIYGEGDDDYIRSIKYLLNDLSINNVNLKGATDNVKKALNNKALFIMTSFYEGYGQSLIEARSQGIPIVVYGTFDALPTIVRDGINGLIIRPFNRVDFVEGIKSILSERSHQKYSRSSILLASETESIIVDEKWKALLLGISNE